MEVDLHSAVGKDNRNADLLCSVHMQRPKQRHRHEQEHKVDEYVTEAKDIFHVIGFRFAHRGRCKTQLVVERGGQWLAREAN